MMKMDRPKRTVGQGIVEDNWQASGFAEARRSEFFADNALKETATMYIPQ